MGMVISSKCFPYKNILKEIWMFLDGALVKVKRRKLKTYIRSYRGVSDNIGIFLVKAKILIRLSIKKKDAKVI